MEQLKILAAQKLSSQGFTQTNFEPQQYTEIDLTMEETEEALRIAREQKYFALKRIEYLEKISKPLEFITLTAEQLFEKYKEQFKFSDEEHERKIKQLCCYFAKDIRFSGDLNKGLLMLGSVGNGKTTLMKFFASNQNFCFSVEAMLDISFDYKMKGEEGVKCYNTNFTASPNIFGKSDYGYCFDDLGTEEIPARHFGESKNIFTEIVQIRYHNGLPFNSTHAITNKTGDELSEIYGTRCYDRMKEMFNVITFKHDSFRGVAS